MLKTLSGSSPIFALSSHTTCSQTETGATIPLSSVGAIDISPCMTFF
jgi:hypothetical protein